MKRSMAALFTVIFLVAADQLSKFWVLAALKGQGSVPVIKDVFELLYVENRGAAFGILQNHQWIFLLIGAVILLALLWIFPKLPGEKHFLGLMLCCVFIGAGAIGNMIDRLFRGYVVDFLYFKLIDFPVFNVADIYVTTASVVLILLILFVYREEDFDKIFSKRV